jgi:hypothetical protein
MAKKKNTTKKTLIDKDFHALVGEVVVSFGHLEDLVRLATAEAICPAVGYPLNAALFARVRFSELVEMYDFTIAYALREAEDHGKLTSDEKARNEEAQKTVRRQLLDVNERRNQVVHASFIENEHFRAESSEHFNAEAMVHFKTTLDAFKPFLNRRALALTETFNPFDNLGEDIGKLIKDIEAARHYFFTFDRHVLSYRYVMWEAFCTWLQEQGRGQ